jgi:hypothetical protein
VSGAVPDLRHQKKAALADRLEALAGRIVEAMPAKIAAANLLDLAKALGILIDKIILLRRQSTAVGRPDPSALSGTSLGPDPADGREALALDLAAAAPSGPGDVRKCLLFRWDLRREQAAQLLAEGELFDLEIAAQVGVSGRQLRRWKEAPEFAARVKGLSVQVGDATLRYAIAKKNRRLQALDERRRAMQQIIAERAADPSMQAEPGGKTGLLVRTVRTIGSGAGAREVEEYRVDARLLRELRQIEKQAAQECGQWGEKWEPADRTAAPALLAASEKVVGRPAPAALPGLVEVVACNDGPSRTELDFPAAARPVAAGPVFDGLFPGDKATAPAEAARQVPADSCNPRLAVWPAGAA